MNDSCAGGSDLSLGWAAMSQRYMRERSLVRDPHLSSKARA